MASRNTGQASASSTVKQQPPTKPIAIGPPKFQFHDLRIGTLNCQSQNARRQKSILEYCEKSGCDIVALQETGKIFNSCTDPRIKTFPKEKLEVDERKEDRGMAFFIRKPEDFSSLAKGKHVHPRIVILRFTFKKVEFILFNVYGVVPDSSHGSLNMANKMFASLKKQLKNIQRGEKNKIVIVCGDMNAFPFFASSGIYSPWIEYFVYGSHNKHGKSFLRFLQSAEMNHLNSRFKKPKDRKWTRHGYTGQENTEIDGFLCRRTDIVQDVDSFVEVGRVSDHRMIGSLWRVSEEYEKYRRTASKDDLMKCNIFKPLHCLLPGNPSVLNHLNDLFSDLEFDVDDYQKKLSDAHKKLTDSEKPVRLTIDEVRKNFSTTTVEIDEDFATNQFNDALLNFNVPSDWKEVYFMLPNQSVFTENVGYYNFPWKMSAFRGIYSNLLACKSNSTLGKYIHGDQWYYDTNSEDLESQREEKAVENILILVLLLLKFKKANKPLYFLFVNLKNAQNSVKIFSVLASLMKAKIPWQLFFAFASLLIGCRVVLETSNKELKSGKYKLRGLHLRKMANLLLLSVVIKTIRDKWDSKDVGIKVGGKSLKSIQFDDQIVLIDDNIDNFGSHLSDLRETSESHGLVFDKNDLILIKNTASTGGTEFTFCGTKIRTAARSENRVVLYHGGQTISVNSTLKYEIKRRVVQVEELITSASSLGSMNDLQKESFFNETLIPKFFYASGTWNPSSKEIKEISDYLQNVWEEQLSLKLPFYELDVFCKILSEKARLIKWLATKPNSFCYELLNEKAEVVGAKWTFQLVKNLNKFKKSRGFQLSTQVHGHTLLSIASQYPDLWEYFITYCETEASF